MARAAVEPIHGKTVGDFLDALASGEPAPGGGAAAALSGGMAAALVAMVCGLTVGREKYRDVEARLRPALERATLARANFLLLADRDQEAFVLVMEAFRQPKGSEEEKAAQQAAVQEALKQATRVPLSTLQQAVEILPDALEAMEFGNQNARSDAASGYHLAQAAFEAALLNVKVNLGAIKDDGFKQATMDQVREALAKRRFNQERAAQLLPRLFPD